MVSLDERALPPACNSEKSSLGLFARRGVWQYPFSTQKELSWMPAKKAKVMTRRFSLALLVLVVVSRAWADDNVLQGKDRYKQMRQGSLAPAGLTPRSRPCNTAASIWRTASSSSARTVTSSRCSTGTTPVPGVHRRPASREAAGGL